MPSSIANTFPNLFAVIPPHIVIRQWIYTTFKPLYSYFGWDALPYCDDVLTKKTHTGPNYKVYVYIVRHNYIVVSDNMCIHLIVWFIWHTTGMTHLKIILDFLSLLAGIIAFSSPKNHSTCHCFRLSLNSLFTTSDNAVLRSSSQVWPQGSCSQSCL